MRRRSKLTGAAIIGASAFTFAQAAPLPIAPLERDTPVNFAKEVAPFLKKNCFSCHNEKKAKADLNLESPETMMKGGDLGPALVPGKPMESLIFTFAAHLEDDPMPPAKNKAKAENLAANQLALLKLWIEQGAKGSSATLLAGPEQWESLGESKTIYSVAISDDGRFAAAGRANRIHVYDLRAGSLAAELIDREGSLGTAHRDHVHSLVFNLHGVLASGGYRSVKLWQRRVNGPTTLAHGLPESATAVAASADGAWLAAGDSKGNVIVQAAATKENAPAQKRHDTPVRALAFSPDGQFVYSVAEDKFLVRSAVADPNSSQKSPLPSEGFALAILENGKTLAVGGGDGIVRLLPADLFAPPNAGQGAPPPEGKSHSAKVIAVAALNAEGTQVVSASEDGTARVWDMTGKQLRQINHGSPIVAMETHVARNRIATAGQDGVVRIWDSSNGNKLAELKGDLDFETRRAATTRVRDVAKRIADLRKKQLGEREKKWNELKEKSKTEAGKITAAVKDLAVKEAAAQVKRQEADGVRREIAALEATNDQGGAGKAKERAKKIQGELTKAEDELTKAERAEEAVIRNRELAVQDASKGAEHYVASQAASTEADAALASVEEAAKALEEEAKTIGPGPLKSLAFSPDGSQLAVGAEKTGLRLWSAVTFQPLDVLQAHRATTAVTFLPDGSLVASFADKGLATWRETATWEKSRQIGDGTNPDPFPGRVLALAFHPRGHLLATGSGVPSRSGQIKLWRLRDGFAEGAIEKAHEDTITGLAFSPDGARLASGSTDRFVKIHHVGTGKLVEQLEGHTSHVLDVAWSADGQTIASAGADKVVKLWIAEEGRQKKTESGFKKEVSAIGFIGIGEGLLTGSSDKVVKAAGQNLPGVDGFVYGVAASPDGATIVAGGESGILRVWRASDRKLLHSFAPPEAKPTETAAR